VPDSCCALNFNQDTTLYWVNPEKLQLKDGLRCQQDAAGNIGNSANLNTKVGSLVEDVVNFNRVMRAKQAYIFLTVAKQNILFLKYLIV
jgi:hypothetical protein